MVWIVDLSLAILNFAGIKTCSCSVLATTAYTSFWVFMHLLNRLWADSLAIFAEKNKFVKKIRTPSKKFLRSIFYFSQPKNAKTLLPIYMLIKFLLLKSFNPKRKILEFLLTSKSMYFMYVKSSALCKKFLIYRFSTLGLRGEKV